MGTTVERKYAMVRVAAGDYLLPSNDRSILWRIYQYEEDGTAEWNDKPIFGKFWGFAKWAGRADPFAEDIPEEFLEWSDHHWQHFDSGYESRAGAIEGALKAELRIAAQRER